jgi:hypothetical protein
MKRSSLTLASLILCGSLLSGCYGQYAATRRVYNWNGTIGNKFARSAVTFGLTIVQVYTLCALGDWIIFNPIEFYTGGNPMAMNDGAVETRIANHVYRVSRRLDDKYEVEQDGRVAYRYYQSGDNVVIEDPQGNVQRVISREEQLAMSAAGGGTL